MSKYPTIPEPEATIEGLQNSVRALKQTVEILAGLRQGQSRGAPALYYQAFQPSDTNLLCECSFWVNPETNELKYWNSAQQLWIEVGS